MPFDVANSIALVTGANRGIGKSIVEMLLKHGTQKVYAAVRTVESAQPLVDAHGDKVVPVLLDLTKPDLIKQAAQVANDVTLVINNGGIFREGNTLSGDGIATLRTQMETNVYGLMHVAEEFAPVLKKNGGGAFVQINSVASIRTFAEFTSYCTSKAASFAVTQGLRVEFSEQGTQVMSVHPGPIKTDMADQVGSFDYAYSPDMVSEAIVEGLKKDQFLVFPDPFAQDLFEQYNHFASNVIEAKQ